MVKKVLLMLIISGFLISCQTTPEKEYKDVYKRVPYCPTPPTVERPVLDIETYAWAENDLTENPEILIVSLTQLKDYAIELERIIASFKKYSEYNKTPEDSTIRATQMSPFSMNEFNDSVGGDKEESGAFGGASDDWNDTQMFDFVEEYKKIKEYRDSKNEG